MHETLVSRLGKLGIFNHLCPVIPYLSVSFSPSFHYQIQYDILLKTGGGGKWGEYTCLIVSEGVTATIASDMPAPRPASIDRGAVNLPYKEHYQKKEPPSVNLFIVVCPRQKK